MLATRPHELGECNPNVCPHSGGLPAVDKPLTSDAVASRALTCPSTAEPGAHAGCRARERVAGRRIRATAAAWPFPCTLPVAPKTTARMRAPTARPGNRTGGGSRPRQSGRGDTEFQDGPLDGVRIW